MRFGVRIGPFYASTSTRRRRASKEPSFGASVTALCLAVALAVVFSVPAQWRWWTLGGIALFAIVMAMVVSTRNDTAKARAAERQKATDFAAAACLPGDRLRLVWASRAGFWGRTAPKPGDLGTFTGPSEESRLLLMEWDNGSSYPLDPSYDQFELAQDMESAGGEADSPQAAPENLDQGT